MRHLVSWNRRQEAKHRPTLDEPYWLALLPGPTTTHLVVDLDNHEFAAEYRDRNRHLVPIAWVGLPYVMRLKQVYDLTPDVLITSSRNLGIHAYWKLPSPVPTEFAFTWMKRQLADRALGDLEI